MACLQIAWDATHRSRLITTNTRITIMQLGQILRAQHPPGSSKWPTISSNNISYRRSIRGAGIVDARCPISTQCRPCLLIICTSASHLLQIPSSTRTIHCRPTRQGNIDAAPHIQGKVPVICKVVDITWK